jgi:hypothetical protein
MAPKKDKADKKDDSPEYATSGSFMAAAVVVLVCRVTGPVACACRDKLQAELKALELAKQDLEIGHAVLADSLRQTRAENERLLQEVERFRNRIINANKDYVGSWDHFVMGQPTGVQQQQLQQQSERNVFHMHSPPVWTDSHLGLGPLTVAAPQSCQ